MKSCTVKGKGFEADVQIPESLLSATSMIATSLHGPLRTQSESSSSLDSESTINIFDSQEQKICADWHHLLASISAAQFNVTLEHNILSKKRKLNQNKLDKMNAVDDNRDKITLFYVYRWN